MKFLYITIVLVLIGFAFGYLGSDAPDMTIDEAASQLQSKINSIETHELAPMIMAHKA